MSELIGRVLGNYHILEQVGRGGMASVFKALDLANERTVAVKVLSPQLALEPNFKVRFEREAQVLRGLEHPNIMPILDYGEESGLAYIVMPFMQVGTLSNRLNEGDLTVEESMRIVGQIASALQHAHEAGVVHRDVKPSNILIDEDGNAWLSDFGFAHVHDATMSLTGSALIGTPAYISPEQVSGKPVSPLSDQYSLAVVVYHLIAGCLPYDAETPMAIALSHVNSPLPRPRLVNPNISRSVEAVLIKALAKDASHRFATIADFNLAFQKETALENEREEKRRNGSLLNRILVKLDDMQADLRASLKRPRLPRRALLIGALLILMTFPVAASDLIRILPIDAGAEEINESGIVIENLQATIDAIHTESALITGTPLLPVQIETIVAETLNAMDAEVMAAAVTGTPVVSLTATNEMTLSLTETAEYEPTATKTVQWVYYSPTPTRKDVKPPQATSTPEPILTPIPPQATSTPEPTLTPMPTTNNSSEDKCLPNKPTTHPHYCEPTPDT